jgi:hypothetical protein
MKFQPGDIVLISHTGEEGKVIDVVDKETFLVEIGGVQVPVYADQMEFPYFKRFSEKKSQPVRNKLYAENLKPETVVDRYVDLGTGLWFIFLPVFDKNVFEEDIVDFFRVYLFNHTDQPYNFSYCQRMKDGVGFEIKNEIRNGQDFYLHTVSMEAMNDHSRFEFEISLLKPDKKKASYWEYVLKIKPKQLFEQIERMLKDQKASFSYQIMQEYPDANQDDFTGVEPRLHYNFNKSHSGFNISKVQSVVDLHIEKLVENKRGMSNLEILTIQLNTFEKHVDIAIAHYQPSLVVIHGVGEGVLKNEIHEKLKFRKEVSRYENRYHPLYGYGATEIYFQY